MSLEFRHIAHVYGDTQALVDISLTAPTGEITCLLGSSGCGKSTLLSLAAGLLKVQSGEIAINGEVMADAKRNPPPEKRPVGMVFQDGALFPHMTVAQNIGFGLGRAEMSRVAEWIDRVGLEELGARYPHELSGGQQQRAAVARAMAPNPAVLLMDEPFASVDIVRRRSLRRELRTLLRSQGATVILVTHDPEEALDVADRIAVMDAGQIVQQGTPQELYSHPGSAMVGAMFGDLQSIQAVPRDQGLSTFFGVWPYDCLAGEVSRTDILDLLVRSEDLVIRPDPQGQFLSDVRKVGSTQQLIFSGSSPSPVMIDYRGTEVLAAGERYSVVPKSGSVHAITAASPEMRLIDEPQKLDGSWGLRGTK